VVFDLAVEPVSQRVVVEPLLAKAGVVAAVHNDYAVWVKGRDCVLNR
jgi:hypothetical protein